MNTALARQNLGELDVKPANPMRGKGFHDHAVAFSETFAIGDTLSADKFDEWAHERGYLNVPFGAKKQSDVWLAHLQRRHQLRYSINKAAMHPRMREENRQPFIIENIGHKAWEVRDVVTALQQNETAKKLAQLADVQKKKLVYLQQSEDFEQLPPYMRLAVTDLSADIDSALAKIDLESRDLDRRIARIQGRIRASIESGEVKPINGGIRGFLKGERSEGEESDG